MATINYAVKYSDKVSEKLVYEAKSGTCINNDYDFTGAKTVKVKTISTSALNDYRRTGTNRFGTPAELNATDEELTLSQQKAFTFVIDALDEDETNMALSAGTALARQIREVVVPHLDKYRFEKMAEAAKNSAEETLTHETAYEAIITASEKLDEAEAPEVGRQLIVSPKTYKLLKQSRDVILDTELSDEQRASGVIAMLDGMEVKKVPAKRLPERCNFIITHPSATCAPVKLAVYRILTEVAGINGSLVEGLIYHDAFVLENNKAMIYASTEPSPMGYSEKEEKAPKGKSK